MIDDDDSRPPFEGWAVVELFGHRKLGGKVSEAEIAGCGFLRVDVPAPGGATITQFYNPKAVYELTPATEEVARAVARRYQPEPVTRFELPPVPAPTGRTRGVYEPDHAFDDDDDDGGDDDDGDDVEAAEAPLPEVPPCPPPGPGYPPPPVPGDDEDAL